MLLIPCSAYSYHPSATAAENADHKHRLLSLEHAQVCFHDVYERSDQALYRAKEKGRNQAVVCTAAYFKTCKPAICIACKSIKYSRFFVIPS